MVRSYITIIKKKNVDNNNGANMTTVNNLVMLSYKTSKKTTFPLRLQFSSRFSTLVQCDFQTPVAALKKMLGVILQQHVSCAIFGL